MYSQLITDLTNAGIQVRQLHGNGHVAVMPAAGRIIALAFSEGGPNLLWSNPALGDTALVKATPEKLAGGFGGDRLWFAPELRYHWLGKPDWRGLQNYQVPADSDPGRYAFFDAGPDVVALAANGRLPVRGSDQFLDFFSRTKHPSDRPAAVVQPPADAQRGLLGLRDRTDIDHRQGHPVRRNRPLAYTAAAGRLGPGRAVASRSSD